PCWMVATLSRRSATALAMEFWLARNSSDLGVILLWSTVIGSYPSVWGRPGLAGCAFREMLRAFRQALVQPRQFMCCCCGAGGGAFRKPLQAHPCALLSGHPWPPTFSEGSPSSPLSYIGSWSPRFVTCSGTARDRSASVGFQTFLRRFRRVSRPAAGGRSGIRGCSRCR